MRSLFWTSLILSTTALFPLCAQENTVQTFSGETPTTTPSFKVQDKWEVRWSCPRVVSIAIYASDGTLVAGGASVLKGSLYQPRGGTYYLQINSSSSNGYNPPSNNNNGSTTGIGQTINQGLNGNGSPGGTAPTEGNTPANNNNPNAGMPVPWHVDVVELGSSPSPGIAMSVFSPNFIPPDSSSGPGPAVATSTASTTPPSPPPASTGPVKLTEDQTRAVVLISGDNAEGTGFLVKTPDGVCVITNIHVIANNPNLKITTNTGAQVKMLSAKGAADRDLAMLTVQDAGYNCLDLATDISQTVQTGDEVITPGNSQGGEVMLNTAGKVLGIGPQRIEIDNPIYHGNSGGPVFHSKSGKVLGVVTEAMKVEVTNDLDKASFASRNSAISGTMRYFALRLDTVPNWVPIDWRRFQIETAFLEQFHQQSRRLDAYLNQPERRQTSNASGGNTNDAASIYRSDDKIVKANDSFVQQASGSDTSQRIEALRGLLFDLNSIADTNVDQIQDMNNFYSFNQERARNELDYRRALKAELESFGNNIDRLGRLPRTNSSE